MKIYLILILIIIFSYNILQTNDLQATAYYVNNNNSQARNSNPGTKESPWLTVQHAADVMVAGDICYVQPGIYNERISPDNSGNAGNLITFKAVGNVIIRGFRLVDRSYIRVIGFEITHNNSSFQGEGFYMTRAHNCEILDNNIHHTYGLGIWCHDSGLTNNVIIRGNTISYTAITDGREIGDTAVYIYGNRNIIEYNNISHIGDFLNLWGENNIVRNNYFHDCYLADFPDYSHSDGHHIDGIQFFSKEITITRTLIENNLFIDNRVPHAHLVILRDIRSTGSSDLLFRNNVGVRNGAIGIIAETVPNVLIVNNTFVDLLNSQSTKNRYCIAYKVGATNGKVKNNIFYNSARDGGMLYYVDDSSQNGFHADYNLVYLSGSPSETHGILHQDPQFRNFSNDDFYLHSSSPGVDRAGPLTTTTNSGTDNVISVDNAGFFTDGWGISEGDYIKIGSNDLVKITDINYNNNSITIDQNISWSYGDAVNYDFEGIYPDMGAYEYRSDQNYDFTLNLVQPSANEQRTGIVTIQAEVDNDKFLRYVSFLINGIPQFTKYESPYTYEWDTQNLPFDVYNIEVRGYSYYATANPVKSRAINVELVENPSSINPPSNLRIIE